MTYATALAALADPTRRRVFEELRSGPKPVGVIAAKLPVSRPAVSQHLKVLRQARLVEAEKQANFVLSREPQNAAALHIRATTRLGEGKADEALAIQRFFG